MSLALFQKVLAFTLKWEGGKVDDPEDLGGRTNYGITQRTYDVWRVNHKLPKQDVYRISIEEVRTIYQTQFWQPSYSYLAQYPLAQAMFDTSVNFNPPSFTRFMRDALNINQPNALHYAVLHGMALAGRPLFMTGDMVAKLKSLTPAQQFDTAIALTDRRIAYRHFRVKQNPSQAKFLKGWLNRDNDLEKHIRGIK